MFADSQQTTTLQPFGFYTTVCMYVIFFLIKRNEDFNHLGNRLLLNSPRNFREPVLGHGCVGGCVSECLSRHILLLGNSHFRGINGFTTTAG